MNSTATCSTLRRMGSVRLYFARDSPCDEDSKPYHTGLVAARVNKDRAFRRTSGRRCQVCYWCIIKDSWKRQHHLYVGTWNTRTLRELFLEMKTGKVENDNSSDSLHRRCLQALLIVACFVNWRDCVVHWMV